MTNPIESTRSATPPEVSEITYKSGVAARLAGLSPETLRVWERRYALSDTKRSDSGQRLYSPSQVQRLSLIKQLVDQGHGISGLARLSLKQLQELTISKAGERQAVGPIRAAVVGDSLARRINASGSDELGITVRSSCPHLEQAGSLPKDDELEVLVIEVSELHESAMPLIAAARHACAASAVVVLYRFCSSATIRALRAQQCLVARIPSDLGELALLCRAALAEERLPPSQPPRVPGARFDEMALSTIAAAGNRVSCECPRHLAEVLTMIGSFERYSAQCASKNADDRRLHQDLERAAGQARNLLEVAMVRLARAEGIPLPD